jgi:hypothetical protein
MQRWSPYLVIAVLSSGLAASAYATRDRVAEAVMSPDAAAQIQARNALAREVAAIAAHTAAVRTRQLLEARKIGASKLASNQQDAPMVARR